MYLLNLCHIEYIIKFIINTIYLEQILTIEKNLILIYLVNI